MPILPDIEPMIPQDRAIERSEIPALAAELERVGGQLSGVLNPITAQMVESHMRLINSYYSNLIEGHDIRPHDIRKAMRGEYSGDPAKRDLQMESLAHIEVQRWMCDSPPAPDELLSKAYLCQIHEMFYARLPDSLRVLEGDGGSQINIKSGELRQSDHEVRVGRHIPPPGEELRDYLARFFEAYRIDRLPPYKRPMAAMAAHHRLLWIHPFLDGNGRVARLFTDAYLRAIGIRGCGIWSLSRGLARRRGDYKRHLAKADEPRHGDRDGRGQRSERQLVALIEFLLKVAVEQASYMRDSLEGQGMCNRIQSYVKARNSGLIPGLSSLKPEAAHLLEKAFLLGEVPCAAAHEIVGLSQPASRILLQQLNDEGLLSESGNRFTLRWAIPEHAEDYYFPQLSPSECRAPQGSPIL